MPASTCWSPCVEFLEYFKEMSFLWSELWGKCTQYLVQFLAWFLWWKLVEDISHFTYRFTVRSTCWSLCRDWAAFVGHIGRNLLQAMHLSPSPPRAPRCGQGPCLEGCLFILFCHDAPCLLDLNIDLDSVVPVFPVPTPAGWCGGVNTAVAGGVWLDRPASGTHSVLPITV